MPKRSSKRPGPKDPNELAKSIVDRATDEAPETEDAPEEQPETTEDGKNAAAVALGKLGGKKGGPARAKKLSAEQRSDIARKAANKRWDNKPPDSA